MLAVALAVVLLTPAGAGASGWFITDLGTLPGGPNSSATGVNDSGEIVGYSEYGELGVDHAFSYTLSGGMVDLGDLGGANSRASAVNLTGTVAGFSQIGCNFEPSPCGFYRAFSYTPAGGMIDLGTLGGNNSYAQAINDTGEIVGFAETTTPDVFHAFSYTASGGMVDLGTLGGRASAARGVNDSGEVVGDSQTTTGAFHAFSYTPSGGMADLGTLPGGNASLAYAVSDSGEVVGYSDVGGAIHPFSYTPSGGMVDLGMLAGSSDASAQGVNDSGEVVGLAVLANGHDRAFSYTPTGGMVDLGTLRGGSSSDAYGVNNDGDIVGQADTSAGTEHAVMWTPDTTPPTITKPPAAAFMKAHLATVAVPITVSWAGTDTSSGINHYDVKESVDGGPFSLIAKPTANTVIVNLNPGHAYQFKVRAIDNAGNTSAFSTGSKFTLLASQETASSITYSSGWTLQTMTGAYGGKVKFSRAASKTATFSFTGSQIAWVSTIGPNRGSATVKIDAGTAATVSTNQTTTEPAEIVYAKKVSSGSHSLLLTNLGTSGTPRVDVDAFLVIK